MTDAPDILQTPTEVINYTINWPNRGIGTATITASAWTQSSADFTLSNQSITGTGTTTTFTLTGGIAGNYYTITNHVTLSDSQQLEETLTYYCEAQRFL